MDICRDKHSTTEDPHFITSETVGTINHKIANFTDGTSPTFSSKGIGDLLKGCVSARNPFNTRGNDGLGTNSDRLTCKDERKSAHHHEIGKKESPNTLNDTSEKNDAVK